MADVSHQPFLRCLAAEDVHAGRFEVLAVGAVADVEFIADDREPHRVCTEQQVAVFDRVRADIDRDFSCAPAVPARTMTCFRFHRFP